MFKSWLLADFELISLIKPDICKNLNIDISGYVNNITNKL